MRHKYKAKELFFPQFDRELGPPPGGNKKQKKRKTKTPWGGHSPADSASKKLSSKQNLKPKPIERVKLIGEIFRIIFKNWIGSLSLINGDDFGPDLWCLLPPQSLGNPLCYLFHNPQNLKNSDHNL